MATKKHSSLDRVLGRLETLDSVNLTNLVQRLARERSLLETVFNTIREGILIVDEEGVVEYANEAGTKMIGLKDSDFGETTLWRLVPKLLESLEGKLGASLPSSPVLLKEIELTYPETRFVRLYMVPFREHGEEDDDTRRFAVILTDITQEKLSTEEMIENEKVSSIFLLAAGVAHELGNPLNSLTIHLQLIRRQLKRLGKSNEAEKIRKSVDVCSGEVDRLDGIISNFLEAIRPVPPDYQDVDLLDVFEEVIRFQSDELKNRGVRVDIELSEPLPVVSADRNQLKQVFFNLTKNAMDAMASGGTLKIRARSDDDYVYIQVGDSGSGISQGDLSKVFRPYYTTKKGGHGLGLMIVQRIMRDHGGHIGIESEEGVGTIISLQFPQKHRRVRLLEN